MFVMRRRRLLGQLGSLALGGATVTALDLSTFTAARAQAAVSPDLLFPATLKDADRPLIWITCDTEAQPGRAESDNVNRLIWGRNPRGDFGIGRMMDLCDRYNATMTCFLDYCEEDLYGKEIADVAREIKRRKHDVQIHSHPDNLRKTLMRNGQPFAAHSKDITPAQAPALAELLQYRHTSAVGDAAVAFRGGGYGYNKAMLEALFKVGVKIDSSYVADRDYGSDSQQSVLFGPARPFYWPGGTLEVPVSVMMPLAGTTHAAEFNFHDRLLVNNRANIPLFMGQFFNQFGPKSVLVLVMHSWEFLNLDATVSPYFGDENEEHIDNFEHFLKYATTEWNAQFVTGPTIMELVKTPGALKVERRDDQGHLVDKDGNPVAAPADEPALPATTGTETEDK